LEKYHLHVDEMLSKLTENQTGFTLLLSHRPDFFAEYANNNIDLTLTGHAHGGQFRIPFIGGLYAPGQGLFPTYDSGLYKKDSSQMIVSRGIGNSSFPFRFNNRPEIILVKLQST
jgi:predicted MPP superfamily phosphohydrolase